jgi:ATP-dependent Clp protease ATP-binding subunit ClpC
MFERFTDQALRVVSDAQDEARGLGHSSVGTEHFLLALLGERDGAAGRILAELGLDRDDAHRVIRERVPGLDTAPAGTLPFTPPAKRALEAARREADALGSRNVATNHLLLGVIGVRDALSAELLDRVDAGSGRVQDALRGSVPESYFPPYYPREPRLWPVYALVAAAGAFGSGIFVGWLIWG